MLDRPRNDDDAAAIVFSGARTQIGPQNARLIDVEIRIRSWSKGTQFSMRRSRAVKTAQNSLVGKDAECAHETRLVGDDSADHQAAHPKDDRS